MYSGGYCESCGFVTVDGRSICNVCRHTLWGGAIPAAYPFGHWNTPPTGSTLGSSSAPEGASPPPPAVGYATSHGSGIRQRDANAFLGSDVAATRRGASLSTASLQLTLVWLTGIGSIPILAIVLGLDSPLKIWKSAHSQMGVGSALVATILGFLTVLAMILWTVAIALAAGRKSNKHPKRTNKNGCYASTTTGIGFTRVTSSNSQSSRVLVYPGFEGSGNTSNSGSARMASMWTVGVARRGPSRAHLTGERNRAGRRERIFDWQRTQRS